MGSPCNCCAQPPAPLIYLGWKSIYADNVVDLPDWPSDDDYFTQYRPYANFRALTGFSGYIGPGSSDSGYYPPQFNTSPNVERIRWKILHKPSASCYLKLWLQTVFLGLTEDDSGKFTLADPVYTALAPYEWTGAGGADGTCIPAGLNLGQGLPLSANWIQGPENELDEPAQSGLAFVSAVKFSLLPGYEPPDDGSADGFPRD